MFVLGEEDRDLYEKVQEQNLLRQYDLLGNCIEIGIKQGWRAFDKYMLWDLNHVAVANISQFGGRFREEPIYVSRHTPPHFRDVPNLMDQFICTIQENWYLWSETTLASYGLWRGNGRTARAACYFLLCVKSGGLLRGDISVPERIRRDRDPYYEALREADAAWEVGQLAFPKMEAYVARLVQDQLMGMPP